ncbi:MAG: glutamate--tRNA ligase [Azospirillum brasilense]|nr:MAG: glutamate--tRNA ligase [Azospirillum brasilense]
MSQEQVFVRFAPSPTGWLHVGNVRTALMNWLFARAAGGRFLLRIDDTDTVRSKAEYEAGLKTDLQWLGLEWDAFEKQSLRFDRYELAKQKLIADGRLYPCYETAEEIDIKRKMLAGRGLPPIYDRAALNDTAEMRAEYEAQGRTPHWRFKLDHKPIVWDDMVRGRTEFDGAKLSDPVLIREDGGVLFTFATSVDDGEMGITHIIRGEDHVSNSAIQIQIMEALGFAAPIMGHMALLKMKEGKISKREGGGDIKSLREEGILPLALVSYLAKIGTSDAIDLAPSLEQLGAEFAITKLGRAMANYDPAELERLNQKLLHQMDFAAVETLLAARSAGHITPEFWTMIRGNLTSLDETKEWWTLVQEPITPTINDKEFTDVAATLLPSGEWGAGSWDEFVAAVKEKTGRKGKELFMPLRLALTGMEHGPEIKVLFALLGRERAQKRLMGEAA